MPLSVAAIAAIRRTRKVSSAEAVEALKQRISIESNRLTNTTSIRLWPDPLLQLLDDLQQISIADREMLLGLCRLRRNEERNLKYPGWEDEERHCQAIMDKLEAMPEGPSLDLGRLFRGVSFEQPEPEPEEPEPEPEEEDESSKPAPMPTATKDRNPPVDVDRDKRYYDG